MNTENKKTFAVFMGFNPVNGDINCYFNGSDKYMSIEHAKYHSSYDWIIPAIKKIIEFDLSAFNYNLSAMTMARQMIEKISNLKTNTPIQELNECALEFIKWYNTQPK